VGADETLLDCVREALAGDGDPGRLWDGAQHREERCAALTLARTPSAREWQDLARLDLCEHLVVSGAWWDLVDETAQHLVGDVLRCHRAGATPGCGRGRARTTSRREATKHL
jgi:hypothetical protein